MSGSVDERIVEMTFKGEAFVNGVKSSVEALLSLKSGLNGLKGSENDINSLSEAGKRFSLSGMSNGIDQITHHFSLLRIAGLTAFSSLVRQGLFAGENLLKAFTIDPIKAGLESYEVKINAIQTILANTASEGTNLKQVTAALSQLNAYSNLTVFNFADMARNIGTFTAAGVGLKTSVDSIKGIANLAALSGSSAQQASTAMYQLSQAIAAGRVKLQDWNSVVNAGLGGKVFQNAILQTARVNGVAVDAMIKKYGSFRGALQSGFLTSKILTETLSEFTGDLSLKQLKAMGFTEAESEAIAKQAKIAVQSATQIRTVSQLTAALKDDVSTAFAGVWEAIIGSFSEAPQTLTGLFNVLSSVAIAPINNLAKLLKSFDQLGGRQLVIQAIGEAFHSLGQVLSVVGQAFREVFPSSGGGAVQGLIKMAVALDRMVVALKPSKQTLDELKTIFVGLFSAIKIVVDVFSALFGGLSKIGGASKGASGGFLALLATLAHYITDVKNAIESSGALAKIFNVLGTILSIPVKAISAVIGALGHLSGGITKVTTAISPFIQKVGSLFSKLGDAIVSGISSGNFNAVASLINQLLIGGILVQIKKFLSGLGKSTGGGLFSTIKESFESLTKTLTVMQTNLKSGILEKIAIAVALLAASLLVLSLINVKDLTKSLAAITTMFVQLLAAMAVVTRIGGSAGILKMEAISLALNLLASAIVILAGAVAILAQFSWDQLARGLSAIAILLLELVVATALMSKNTVGLLATAVSMNVIAGALNVLALAVALLGRQSLDSLAKGIGSIAILLAILSGFNAISGVQLVSTAAAMLVLGGALEVITQAVIQLGKQSVGTLAKGLIAVAAALVIIALAMSLMPPTMIVTAGALLVVSAALVIMAQALTSLGGLSWTAIAKSLVELAGSLTILAIAMAAMTGGLPGAAALLVMTAALAVLTPVLIALGNMSWEAIAKGLLALVGVFLVLAAAGVLLTPLIPSLLGLAGAVALFGLGVLAAGAGVLLFATGLGALALAVTASGAAILSFVTSILSLIPATFKVIGLGLVAFATAVGTGAVAIENAFVAIFSSLLNAIIRLVPLGAKAFGDVMVAVLGSITKYSPQVISTFTALLFRMLDSIQKNIGRFVSEGANIIIAFLNGVGKKIGAVANAATNVVISFINAIGNDSLRISRAGINMVINLINGVANQIRSSSPRIHAAAANLGSAIIGGMVAGIRGGLGSIISAAANMASNALSAARNFLDSHSPSRKFMAVGADIAAGTAIGVTSSISVVEDSMRAAGSAMLTTLANTLSQGSSVVTDNLDLQPMITPVLDLSQAKKGFDDLNAMSGSSVVAATASTSSAATISASNAAAAATAGAASGGGTNLTFNQNNYSPTALSATDIYRKTKNQLSIAKGALK